MTHNYIYKTLRALCDLPFSLRRTPSPHIVMTLLVKNEEQLLADNIEFHHAMGVEHFIITDNNSSDRTPEIIRQYQEKGWVLEVINETSTGYEQKAWVDRMIELAREKYHADWVINADADEFWYPKCGDFRKLLSQTRATVLEGHVHNVYPQEGKEWKEWNLLVREVPNAANYDLSPYSIFAFHRNKLMHRTRGYLQISMGNHRVKMLPYRCQQNEITIFHFNLRSRQQFIDKMVNGGKELEAHKDRHGGRHWRYYYSIYKEGRLAEEYDRMIGTSLFEQLKAANYIFEDNRLRDAFKTIKAGKE